MEDYFESTETLFGSIEDKATSELRRLAYQDGYSRGKVDAAKEDAWKNFSVDEIAAENLSVREYIAQLEYERDVALKAHALNKRIQRRIDRREEIGICHCPVCQRIGPSFPSLTNDVKSTDTQAEAPLASWNDPGGSREPTGTETAPSA